MRRRLQLLSKFTEEASQRTCTHLSLTTGSIVDAQLEGRQADLGMAWLRVVPTAH